MIYIDASFYIALLNGQDSNHQKALQIADQSKKTDLVTSQLVIGEVLTVGSMRIDKEVTVAFVEKILKSNTEIILENPELIKAAFEFFKKIRSKNISWVDCFSIAIMKKMKIKKALTFDNDFKKYTDLYR
jgi:predicted nucleic acid-binding protein